MIGKSSVTLNEIKSIVKTVKENYGFDFSNYAMSSFQRRIMRILTVYKFKNVESLIERLATDLSFYDIFLEEITVNTTEMFRDPEMWSYLKSNIFNSLKRKSYINIWHAGCSSGEEVFSMAILLKEMGIYNRCNLIATDINSTVIEKAKSGIYSSRNMVLNRENYERFGGEGTFTDYFQTDGNKMIMNKDLLNNVNFRVHNLVKDVEFAKFDIILCRNVMIYFDKVLQEDVFQLFHKSLLKQGHFILGSKESMVWSTLAKKFKQVNDKERIYQVVS